MRVVESVSDAGDGVCNEDRAGQAGELAWVIDGATSLTDRPVLPARTDAEWLADHVTRYLTGTASRRLPDDLPSLYADIAGDVARVLAQLRFPPGTLPPACSCGIVRRTGDTLTMGIVGDAFLYVPGHDVLLSDPLFARREAAGVGAASATPGATPGTSLLVADRPGIAARRREYISGSAGSFVLSNNPAVSAGVRQATVRVADGQAVLLCTDGFARLVDPYGLYPSWAELADAARGGGLAGLLAELRGHERETGPAGAHYKRRDDACALLVEL